MSEKSKDLTKRSEVDAFLQKVAALPAVQKSGTQGRLMFALDATASRERTWDHAMQLQAEMFLAARDAGGLQVQLTYFRGFAEFYKTPWCRDSGTLLGLMTGIQCRGGTTQIERVLRHALSENKEKRIHCVVYVGDSMEESAEILCQLAGQLGMLNVPLFMFQEGADPLASATFTRMAKLSKGAYSHFDSASAAQLRELLRAVAVYASGGLKALEQFSSQASEPVRRLTKQMRS
tara:strand:+ start:24968 stop:25669 length:702 start_codon:yes stop_codon:yes gene_type:complete